MEMKIIVVSLLAIVVKASSTILPLNLLKSYFKSLISDIFYTGFISVQIRFISV